MMRLYALWIHCRDRGLRVLRPCPCLVPFGDRPCHIPDERVSDSHLLVAHTVPMTERPRDPRNLPVEVRTWSLHKSDIVDRWRSSFNTPATHSPESRVTRSLLSRTTMAGQSRGCCDIDEIASFITTHPAKPSTSYLT